MWSEELNKTDIFPATLTTLRYQTTIRIRSITNLSEDSNTSVASDFSSKNHQN
mgnify:CR=1 FL=1